MSTAITTRQTAGTGATVAGVPLTNTQVDTNFINLNIAVQPAGGTAGQVLSKIDGTDFNSQWIDNFSTAIKISVKNSTGVTITKGSVVYVSGATGANVLVALAKADAESTSSQTLGFVEADIVNGASGNVVYTGTITGVNTIAYTEGDPVYLSSTTAGGIVVGLANKPTAPAHLVYLGVITRSHAVNGEIQIRVSNGWELNEIHDVQIVSKADNDILQYNSASAVWKNVTPATARTNLGLAIGTDVQAFSSSLTAISASQTANYFLAAPNGAAGVPTFRALVAADVPTLNQNTTGSAGSVPWSGVSSKPTTLSGFGITDGISTAGGTVTTTNSTASFTVTDTGTSGANIKLIGNGATTPNKTIRTFGGQFQVVNNAYTTAILTLDDSGNLTATANITAYSDETLKANWRDPAADFVDLLAGVKHGTYDRLDIDLTQDGVSAQALRSVMPHSVFPNPDGTLSVNYGGAAMVSAVQLAKRLVALEATVAKLVD